MKIFQTIAKIVHDNVICIGRYSMNVKETVYECISHNTIIDEKEDFVSLARSIAFFSFFIHFFFSCIWWRTLEFCVYTSHIPNTFWYNSEKERKKKLHKNGKNT